LQLARTAGEVADELMEFFGGFAQRI
jgi:hypothetical protein